MPPLTPSRRRFLSALGTTAALPLLSLPGFVQAAGAAPSFGRILVLIELAGGNDGLNTVVPHRDPAYRALRPAIGLDPQGLLTLDRDTGLHPAMGGFAGLWEEGALRIVEGVGYPDPNRSHFRSIEIWNTGLGAQSQDRAGWVSTAFSANAPTDTDTDGLVLGGEMGPLAGPGRFSAMRDEAMFFETIGSLPGMAHPVRPQGITPLDHVLATYESAQATGERISAKLEASRPRGWSFPQTEIGEQLRTAARLLDAGVEVPVLKVTQNGYDTHDAQPEAHAALLTDLSEAVTAFAAALQDMGLWQETTLMTYSEFGRTARQNASDGTDHGTAAPVFVTGGAVEGGFAGARPDLGALVEDDLVHTTDYRQLYGAVLSDLWGLTDHPFAVPGAEPLTLLRSG